MTDKELINLLKENKNTPALGGAVSDSDWQKSWSKICYEMDWNAQDIKNRRLSIFDYLRFASHNFIFSIMQPVVMGIAVIVLILGSWTTVVNASYALPGDTLYPIKLATEKVRLSIAVNNQDRARLHVEFAGRRLNEISQIKKTNNNQDLVKIAVDDFNNQMDSVNQELNKLNNQHSQSALDLAVMINEKTSEYQETLNQNNQLNNKVEEDVVSALETVNQTDDVIVETMVSSHENTGAIRAVEALKKNYQDQYSHLHSNLVFSLGRLSLIQNILENNKEYHELILNSQNLLKEGEKNLNQSMNIMASGGYRSAFDLLDQAENNFNQAKEIITEMEIEITKPKLESDLDTRVLKEKVKTSNKSFEEVVEPTIF